MAVHGLAILLGRNEAGISNRRKLFLHHAVDAPEVDVYQDLLISHFMFASILLPNTYPYIEGSRVSVMEAHLNATGSC